MIEILEDVVGVNDDGIECHPFRGIKGNKTGFYSYALSSDNTSFKSATELQLRKLIEDGAFLDKGRIRMIPKGAETTAGAGAMKVQKYNGKAIR